MAQPRICHTLCRCAILHGCSCVLSFIAPAEHFPIKNVPEFLSGRFAFGTASHPNATLVRASTSGERTLRKRPQLVLAVLLHRSATARPVAEHRKKSAGTFIRILSPEVRADDILAPCPKPRK